MRANKKRLFAAVFVSFITFTASAVTRIQLPEELKTFFMNDKEYREGRISSIEAQALVLSHINSAVLEMGEREKDMDMTSSTDSGSLKKMNSSIWPFSRKDW